MMPPKREVFNMAYSFPKLQFDRSKYLSLNEAFHTLGCFLFPDKWTGLEISSWPQSSTKTLREEKNRLRLEAEFTHQQATDMRLELPHDVDPETYTKLKAQLDQLQAKANCARIAEFDFGRSFEGRIKDAAAFERKQLVEETLCRAIHNVDLRLFVDSGTVYGSMPDWTNRRDFKISFSFSLIITPQTHGFRQRCRAHFLKSEFEAWSQDWQAELSAYKDSMLEDDLVHWFKTLILECSKEGRRMNRKTVRDHCKEKFPRIDEFDRLQKKLDAVWDLYAPDNWLTGGKT